ncbi:MAG: C40 family peptidase [Lachnospiraceae bacterium]|nr:C40 family peptidase [Lachnospiraceae bacterium]
MSNNVKQVVAVLVCLALILLTAVFASPDRNTTEQDDGHTEVQTEQADEPDGIQTEKTYDIPQKDYKDINCAGIEKLLRYDETLVCNDPQDENLTEIKEVEDEYSDFAIANVDQYVNVRSEANTDSEIVGRMYDGAVAQIQEAVQREDGEWLKVISGNAQGYIKAEYFIYGEDAARVIDDYVDRYAVVKADRLNIREDSDIESKRIGYAERGEKLKLADDKNVGDEWIYVNYGDEKRGYVSADYISVEEEFIYAKTMDEIKAEEEEKKALLARAEVDEETAPEDVTTPAPAETAEVQIPASGNVRSDIVNFAMQYVGYPYVHGGNSLETGTDCSGFTSLVYAQFGYGLSRTPAGQLSGNGRSISLDEAQPGDIICYGKSKCTHVAIYIGNGQIVHAANPRKGVVIYNVGYDNILGVKNVVD